MTIGMQFNGNRRSKFLFISPYISDKSSGGGIVSKSNLSSLSKINHQTVVLSLNKNLINKKFINLKPPSNKFITAVYNFFCISGRLTISSIYKSCLIFYRLKPSLVFLDSSSLGILALIFKLINPKIRIVSFFHNIEYDFQMSKASQEGYLYLVSAAADFINEKLAIKYCNDIVMLTKEDSIRSGELYNRQASFLLPVAIEDSLISTANKQSNLEKELNVIFVGSNFYANRAAVEFIIKELAPALFRINRDIKFKIIGKSLVDEKISLNIPPNVHILGFVEEILPHYKSSFVFIAPIFFGSGMKVKVAEALMNQLPVIGTPLAFHGYINDDENFPHLITALTVNDFVDSILYAAENQEVLTSSARKDFINRFTSDSSFKKMSQIIYGKIL